MDIRASNPTTAPTELRAACGCRFEPFSNEPQDDSGTLKLSAICVPHSHERTNRLEENKHDN